MVVVVNLTAPIVAKWKEHLQKVSYITMSGTAQEVKI
jgi:hypothetical protein